MSEKVPFQRGMQSDFVGGNNTNKKTPQKVLF